MRSQRTSLVQSLVLFGALFGAGLAPASAALVDNGDLTTIADASNLSDGLSFLDVSFSVDRNLSDALANAQVTFPTARLATPSEVDDLFAAAGITFGSNPLPSAAWDVGEELALLPYATGNPSTLLNYIGFTEPSGTLPFTAFWTDPDGDPLGTTTRDFLSFSTDFYRLGQTDLQPPIPEAGWALVVDAVPEPSILALFGVGLAGLGAVRGRRNAS